MRKLICASMVAATMVWAPATMADDATTDEVENTSVLEEIRDALGNLMTSFSRVIFIVD